MQTNNTNSIPDDFNSVIGDSCLFGQNKYEGLFTEDLPDYLERTTIDPEQKTCPSDRDEVDEPQDIKFDRALMSLGERPVVLCIGTDRVTGDCLGPLVGQILMECGVNAFVYGSLRRPITALSLVDTVKQIRLAHGERKVLAIDSSVGRASDVGKIRIEYDAIRPGSADGKRLPKVGDVSITATVTDPRKLPLSAVRLGAVYELATKIAARIIRILQ